MPRDLDVICQRCLRKEPENWYGSADELADDLDRWLEGQPIHAQPLKRWERAWMRAKRRPAVTAMHVVLTIFMFVTWSGGVVTGLWQIADEARSDLGVAMGDLKVVVDELEEAKAEEEQAKEKLARVLTLRQVGLANAIQEKRRPGEARRLLLVCPQDQRDWGWHDLDRRWKPLLVEVRLDAHSISPIETTVVFSTSGKRCKFANKWRERSTTMDDYFMIS